MHSSILVIAAHPDDEVLGCGGTLAKLSDQGAKIHVAFMADGIAARGDGDENFRTQLEERRRAAKKAADILGITSLSFGDFPDNRMDTLAMLDMTQMVEALVDEHRPDTVITHHIGDVNVDHQLSHKAVVTACRPQPDHPVRKLLCFEVPSNTEWQLPGSAAAFEPNYFVDISATLERKLAALNAYTSEVRGWPHPRSLEAVEHLNRWRGSIVGKEAAEAFMLGRRIA